MATRRRPGNQVDERCVLPPWQHVVPCRCGAVFLIVALGVGLVGRVPPARGLEVPAPLATATPPPQLCGNGVVEGDEDCDPGGICVGSSNAGARCTSSAECYGGKCQTFGGSGCAANCTFESDVVMDIRESNTIIQGGPLMLPLPLTGAQIMTIGKPRNSRIPVVIKEGAVKLDPINVSGLACACLRGVAAKTCGGTFFEPDGITLSPDCTQDESVCIGRNPCTFLHGPGNVASGTVGCDSLDGTDVKYTQDAGGSSAIHAAPVISFSGAGGPGSALILDTLAIGMVIGNCTGTAAAYGADGELCTDDDPASARGAALTLPFTTGTATAAVFNANDQDGLVLGPVWRTGTPFRCDALAHGDTEGSALASAFTQLDVPLLGDAAVASLLIGGKGLPQCCDPKLGTDICVPVTCPPDWVVTPTPTPASLTPRPPVPAVWLETVSASPNTQVQIRAWLQTGGALVAGVQNNIIIVDQSAVAIAARSDSEPDCWVNPTIRKDATAFRFWPTGMRAIVVALDNTAPIPDGSVLYTCNLRIGNGSGTVPLPVRDVVMSDPRGHLVAYATGIDGAVVFGPIQTYPVMTPTPTPAAVSVEAGSVTGEPGDEVTVPVIFHSGGFEVAGVQNDIGFDPTKVWIAALEDGTPDCAVNSAINKNASTFGFLPPGCAGSSCTGVRALIFSLDNTAAIPDGAALYTCNIEIAPTASGTIPLRVSGVILSDPTGGTLPSGSGVDGAVLASPFDAGATPTSHDTGPTATPVPVRTATTTPAAAFRTTPAATPTASPTVTRSISSDPFDQDGCQIEPQRGSGGALLLLPIVGLLVRRHRRRLHTVG